AYRRAENNYLNHLLAEQPNGNFAETIARQLYMSTYELLMYEQLSKSTDPDLSAIAVKALKEIRYHFRHVSDWVIRLGDGTETSHAKMQKALNDLWMFTGELFEMDENDEALLRLGISVDLIPLKPKWQQKISEVLKEATLSLPENDYMQSGGRKGIHTEHMGHILAEMQYLQRAYPDAIW
ncbi:MAG: 1,2-phenylacetyl-CoA epoxidase subunit PaaC, partial [Bacteroidia bacterium]